jgi:hypothetical protein
VFKLSHPQWRCGPTTLKQLGSKRIVLRDEFDYKPTNTMKTAYCSNVSILVVNKQVNREASPFLGCRNNWVRLTVIRDWQLIGLLHRTGCARPLPYQNPDPGHPSRRSPGIWGPDVWAAHVWLARDGEGSWFWKSRGMPEDIPEDTPITDLAMPVQEFKDLATFLCYGCCMGVSLTVQLNKDKIFPECAADDIESWILKRSAAPSRIPPPLGSCRFPGDRQRRKRTRRGTWPEA